MAKTNSMSRRVSLPAEPTEAMIEAGAEVLWTSGAVEGALGSDKLLVAEIFEAMCRAGL